MSPRCTGLLSAAKTELLAPISPLTFCGQINFNCLSVTFVLVYQLESLCSTWKEKGLNFYQWNPPPPSIYKQAGQNYWIELDIFYCSIHVKLCLLFLLNVFQMSDKSIALMWSRLWYFYLRIHFCPLTKIIKMYSGNDCQRFPLTFPFFPSTLA